MALTPQITLTATLKDIAGAAAGSAANPARLVIDLCGYGLTIPEIAATGTLAKIHLEILSTGAMVTTLLWGNDVITPGPDVTYYAITVIDGDGNVVQTGNYRFDGNAVTIDLSDAVPIPIVPPAPPDPLPRWLEVMSVAGVATFDGNLVSAISGGFHLNLTEDVTVVIQNMAKGVPYFVCVEQKAPGGFNVVWPDNFGGPIFPVNSDSGSITQQAAIGSIDGLVDPGGWTAVAGGIYLP